MSGSFTKLDTVAQASSVVKRTVDRVGTKYPEQTNKSMVKGVSNIYKIDPINLYGVPDKGKLMPCWKEMSTSGLRNGPRGENAENGHL